MPDTSSLIAFSLIALGIVLTPGPNMVYLVSRSILQGRMAGLISLVGVAMGFVFYMVCAAFGITALVMAVPYAYDGLRIAGALYLLYLAWKAVSQAGHSPFEVTNLRNDSAGRLLAMGFLTNLLNPKIAVMYLTLLPQFVSPEHGSILGQSLVLGFTQIVISVGVNGLIVFGAGSLATLLRSHQRWIVVQKWLMGTVLAGLAVRMAVEVRR